MGGGGVAPGKAEAVLALLAQAARDGAPCPKSREMAQAAGVAEGSVHYILSRLIARGDITVERKWKRRRITITATGECTKWTSAQQRVADNLSPEGSVREQVRAEADAAAARRDAAGRIGSLRGGAALSVGQRIQIERISDGPGAGLAVLREAWPGTVALLARLCARTGERPLPAIVRLIREEAERAGVGAAHDGGPGGGFRDRDGAR